MKALTDLEAAALGCIWRSGGCTAYAVRSHFRSSLSSRFSDSAGSVYPLVERLLRRRLLRSRKESTGRRPARIYECTPAGLDALRAWLAVPDTPGELVPWDPLRTRVLHLALLSPRERLRWLDRVEDLLQEHIAEVRRAHAEDDAGTPWMRLAHRNTLLLAQARARWLREVRGALSPDP